MSGKAASASTVAVTGSIRGVGSSTVTLSLASESEMFLGSGGSWWPVAGHKTLSSLQALFLQSANNLSDVASKTTAFNHIAPVVTLPAATGVAATDTANWQAALNAAAGGILVVHVGGKTVPGQRQPVGRWPHRPSRGTGWNTATPTVKLANSSGAACVLGSAGFLANATSSGRPIVIRDLSIDVNGANNATSHGIVIMSFSSVIEHNMIQNAGLCGIVQSDANLAGTAIGNTAVENVISHVFKILPLAVRVRCGGFR